MTGDARRHHDAPSWHQLDLVGPTLVSVRTVVHLDGLRGVATYSTLVTHGVERMWVACHVVHGVPLTVVSDRATSSLASAVRNSLNCLSPF